MKQYIVPFLCLFFVACATNEEKELLQDMLEKNTVQEAFNVTFIFSDSAKVQAVLKAPHVIDKVNEENVPSDKIFDQGFEIEFYNPDGEVKSRMTANRGVLNQLAGIGVAKGNVIVTNNKQEELRTERLNWDRNKDILHTGERVSITTAEEKIFADSMVANTDFSQYFLYDIVATLKVKE